MGEMQMGQPGRKVKAGLSGTGCWFTITLATGLPSVQFFVQTAIPGNSDGCLLRSFKVTPVARCLTNLMRIFIYV
jgi:hypothetical protein